MSSSLTRQSTIRQSTTFNEKYSQSDYFTDQFNTTVNTNYLPFDASTPSDPTVVDSTISFGASNRYMLITAGPGGISTSFWKRMRSPGKNVSISFRVNHAASSNIAIYVLGQAIQCNVSGQLTISNGTSLTIPNYDSTKTYRWVIRTFGASIFVSIITSDTVFYNLMSTATTVPSFPFIGYGPGKYTQITVQKMKDYMTFTTIGSSISTGNYFNNCLNLGGSLFTKNIGILNLSANGANLVSGIDSQFTFLFNNPIVNAFNIVLFVLQVDQINQSSIAPVLDFLTILSNYAALAATANMTFWCTTMLPLQTSDLLFTIPINEQLNSIPNVSVIDIHSVLVDPTTGLLNTNYIASTSPTVFTFTFYTDFTAVVIKSIYDALDDQLVNTFVQTSNLSVQTVLPTSIKQGNTILSNVSFVNQGHEKIAGTTIYTSSQSQTGFPTTSGVRPSSTKLIYAIQSFFDIARGIDINTSILWDSFTTKYQQYCNGALVLENTSSGLGLFANSTISASANPTSTAGGTLNVLGDTLLSGTIFSTGTTYGSPSFSTRSPGTRIVLKSSTASNVVDSAFGVVSAGDIWCSTPTTFGVFQNTVNVFTTSLAKTQFTNNVVINGISNTQLTLLGTSGTTGYDYRIDTVSNALTLEKINNFQTNTSEILSTWQVDVNSGKTKQSQNIFIELVKGGSTFTINSNQAITGFTQCGRVVINQSLFPSGTLPQGYSFTLFNNFINVSSVIQLTISTSSTIPITGSGSSAAIVRHSNITTGSCKIDCIIIAGTSPPTTDFQLHYTIV